MTSPLKNPILSASTRDERQKVVRRLRKQGYIPAILYGHGVENVLLKLASAPFEKVYRSAGGSTLVDLKVDDRPPVKAIIQDVTRDPITGRFQHVDFHQVKMTEKITTEVALTFVGESKAVKGFGGVLVKNLDRVKIECLPGDLVHEIPVGIAKLEKFEDRITIKDLTVPNGITLLEKTDEVVCLVVPPRSEEELKALEEKPEEKVEEVGTVEKPKAEEEAEGEEAAAGSEPKAEAEKKEKEKEKKEKKA